MRKIKGRSQDPWVPFFTNQWYSSGICGITVVSVVLPREWDWNSW